MTISIMQCPHPPPFTSTRLRRCLPLPLILPFLHPPSVPRSGRTLFHAAFIYISALRVQNDLSALRPSLRALRVKHLVLKNRGGYEIVSILIVLTDVDTQIGDCYCLLNCTH